MKTPYIILKNINHSQLDVKYNFKEYKEKNKAYNMKGTSSINKTKLYDFKDNSCFYSYIDEAKSDHICLLTMHDVVSNQNLPKQTNLSCYHCHHGFSNIPLGCPIDFKNSKIYKNYYSEITKNNYILQESIVSTNQNRPNHPSYFQTEVQPLNYYVTDAIFCSFNCCKAFIQNNKNIPIYTQSEYLLNKIYKDLFETTEKFHIEPAPDWRLLEKYGGPLSIDEFRKNFYKIDYITKDEYMTNLPSFKSIGFVYEKKIKL